MYMFIPSPPISLKIPSPPQKKRRPIPKSLSRRTYSSSMGSPLDSRRVNILVLIYFVIVYSVAIDRAFSVLSRLFK